MVPEEINRIRTRRVSGSLDNPLLHLLLPCLIGCRFVGVVGVMRFGRVRRHSRKRVCDRRVDSCDVTDDGIVGIILPGILYLSVLPRV